MTATGCKDSAPKPAATAGSSAPVATTAPTASAPTAIKDPDGRYKLFSDPRIKNAPAAGFKVGNGQVFSVEYPSGTDTVFYDLSFVDRDGVVRPAKSSSLVTKDQMLHSSEIVVFDSDADGRPGFMSIHTVGTTKVDDSGKVSGQPVRLGVYAVTIETKK